MDLKNIGVIDSLYWEALYYCVRKNYNLPQMIQSISPKQIECKSWLIEELHNIPIDMKHVQLFGGWNGYPLIDFLIQNFDIETIRNIDMDSEALSICNKYKNLFKHNNIVKIEKADILQLEKDYSNVDLVINTSSEHMPDLSTLIQNKQYKNTCVFALQSNNMFHLDEHTNCVNNVNELEVKSRLSKILYKGTKIFNEYERYMVIGIV